MAAIDDLIAQIEDKALRERLRLEMGRITKEKKFGLVFEDHLPELTPVYSARVRKGCNVALRDGALSALWRVLSVQGESAECVNRSTGEKRTIPLVDLVVVRQFGEPIFPALVPVERVQNGAEDAPWHSLIEADNYHALQLLEYLYAGQVDCIYIDPPYNSGAKDWKYNNNYVDTNDQWRHSKWLAMMQRRLKLAKRLLNPENSVLIVTIDEKEYLRLGLLLEQEFPEARIQMVSSVINHSGVARAKEFYRADEYLFFVFMGDAAVVPTGQDMLNPPESFEGKKIDLWRRLLRSGTNARRQDGVKQFYPFWIDPKQKNIHSVGNYIPLGVSPNSVVPPVPGLVACWPIRSDNSEGCWQISADTARKGLAEGTVRIGAYSGTKGRWSISYLRNAEKERIKRGEIEVTGRDENDALILKQSETIERVKYPVSVWNQRSHNAGAGGSNVIRALIPTRRFPFPKSLYAVEDAIRFFVANKPNALILDFFAGSGTTAHAVMRLNRQDGGHRRAILVTNNEVSAEEQKSLQEQGLYPGHPDWEKLGICQHITLPRLAAAITGKTPKGEPVKGDYKFTDEFPMEDGFSANLEYFRLDFLDKNQVALGRQFREILPILWLKAGAIGTRPEIPANQPIPAVLIPPQTPFAVLVEESHFATFLEQVEARPDLTHVFLVTDSEEAFQEMAAQLNVPNVMQLYRDYLENFVINKGERAA
ncbi:MAG: site-specific DNA-methyltransferase [Candidatus Thiothrix sulfatifontis]|nr:MAG: site-specific DNA-methyltransferase [Candidatus Thiothrix sulfatifontis]